MSKAKHTKGQLTIHGHGTESNPSCVIGTENMFLFQTVGDNDEANAERLVKVWNAHDPLMAALGKIEKIEAGCKKRGGGYDAKVHEIAKAALAEARKQEG